jgi:hypothetical protein
MSIQRILFPAALLIFALGGNGCKRNMSREDVENQLKMAFYKGLYESVHNDSSQVKFEVKKVSFFEDKYLYDCEFTVRLKKPGYDTTGVMGATVSKDFKTIRRKY